MIITFYALFFFFCSLVSVGFPFCKRAEFYTTLF